MLGIINEILKKKGKPVLERLNPKLSLTNDLGLDSLDLAELTVRIEDRFGVDVFEDSIIDKIHEIIGKLQKG